VKKRVRRRVKACILVGVCCEEREDSGMMIPKTLLEVTGIEGFIHLPAESRVPKLITHLQASATERRCFGETLIQASYAIRIPRIAV
jgi:hypothetical protein